MRYSPRRAFTVVEGRLAEWLDLSGGPLIGWRTTRKNKARFNRDRSRTPAPASTRAAATTPLAWASTTKEPPDEPNSMSK